MTLENDFLQLEASRRSVYTLGKNVTLTEAQLVELIKTAVKEAPTASKRAMRLYYSTPTLT